MNNIDLYHTIDNSKPSEHVKEQMMRPIAHICSDFPTKFGIPRNRAFPSLCHYF